MKVSVEFKDQEVLQFMNVTDWFISNDNKVVHIKLNNKHNIIPVSEIFILTAENNEEKI